jgi:hypothetical protein
VNESLELVTPPTGAPSASADAMAAAKGTMVGTLTCTCKVLTAMKQLQEQLATARAAEAEKRTKETSGSSVSSQRIVVQLTAIRLKDKLAKTSLVRIEIDMPGDYDAGELRAVEEKMSSGRAGLRLVEAYDVSDGTPLRQAMLEALASPEKDDGEIQLVVLGVDPKDKSKRTELGVSAPLIAWLVAI